LWWRLKGGQKEGESSIEPIGKREKMKHQPREREMENFVKQGKRTRKTQGKRG